MEAQQVIFFLLTTIFGEQPPHLWNLMLIQNILPNTIMYYEQ